MAAPHLKALVLACALALTASAAFAQLRIGQTVGVTGAVAATVKESMQGAQLYLDHVNAKGGVGGEKIEIVTLDDAFGVKKAEANARTLIEERGVLALFMSRGTPHTEAINTVLEQHRVALIGPSTGAMVLHQPVKPYIFNVRATYQREAERAMAHLASIGVRKVAVVHVDDSFGADGLQGARNGLKAARVGGQYLTLSNNASGGFIKLLGDQAQGVIVSQVMPASLNFGLVKEATQLAKAKGVDEVSPAMLEGFASAKVLVEGLRRAGAKPSRASLHQALDNLGRLDLGGLVLDYSPSDHTGLDFADLSIVGTGGRFRR